MALKRRSYNFSQKENQHDSFLNYCYSSYHALRHERSLFHMQKTFLTLLLILFIGLMTKCGKKKEQVIFIQPYGEFSKEWSDAIQSALNTTYQLPCSILNPIPLPSKAFTRIKTPRYRADSLLVHLRSLHPDPSVYVMGLTTSDISTTKYVRKGQIKKPIERYRDWGIFGLGQCPGRSSVLSSHRLQTRQKALFIERLQKVAVHELGHNMGLPHCKRNSCVMQDAAESIRTIDGVAMELCSSCGRKLQFSIRKAANIF